jgi:hypothetical protein
MASMEVYFVSVHRRGVIVSTSWRGSEGFWFVVCLIVVRLIRARLRHARRIVDWWALTAWRIGYQKSEIRLTK